MHGTFQKVIIILGIVYPVHFGGNYIPQECISVVGNYSLWKLKLTRYISETIILSGTLTRYISEAIIPWNVARYITEEIILSGTEAYPVHFRGNYTSRDNLPGTFRKSLLFQKKLYLYISLPRNVWRIIGSESTARDIMRLCNSSEMLVPREQEDYNYKKYIQNVHLSYLDYNCSEC